MFCALGAALPAFGQDTLVADEFAEAEVTNTPLTHEGTGNSFSLPVGFIQLRDTDRRTDQDDELETFWSYLGTDEAALPTIMNTQGGSKNAGSQHATAPPKLRIAKRARHKSPGE